MISTAILTKYLGPTNNLGTRIKASAECGQSLTLPRQHNLEPYLDHRRVAEAFRDKMGWTGNLVAGTTAHGYVFVFADEVI